MAARGDPSERDSFPNWMDALRMDLALVDQTSEQFLGQWKRLVSTTNWEKGQIIHEWRAALTASDAPPSEYSDEAWSRRVGNITPQHVGRLRRAHERFASTRDDYPGLYWSHFQAALDWDDAEMWLEGAVQNGWSISEMRDTRWQTTGAVADDAPVETDGGAAEPWDDDAESADPAASGLGVVHAAEATESLDEEDADDEDSGYDHDQFDDVQSEASADHAAAVRPFAELPALPPDVNDAFEAYKLCILRHKLAGWQEISRDDLLISLDSLKQLALAPAGD
jgi:hypothetical protein